MYTILKQKKSYIQSYINVMHTVRVEPTISGL